MKKTETIKKDKSKINNAISEINNTLEGKKSSLDEAEDRISVLEDKVEKNTQIEQQKEKSLKKWEEFGKYFGQHEALQHAHHGNTRRRKSEQGIENLFEEIMTENFPNLVKEKGHKSPGSSGSPKQVEPKKGYTETHHN